ncbi:HRDC domain-containing protein [Aneurinibacillus sp. REN35]|uniref:HRDC domain-containing protein n=1 Tax=Aneurinibacillus sp. REN35 TaxID=3237286 RepID=UPI003527CC81
MSVLRQLIQVETYEGEMGIAKLALYERDKEYKLVRYHVSVEGEEENFLLYSGTDIQVGFEKFTGERRLLRFSGYTPLYPGEASRTQTEWNQDMLALSQDYYSPDALGLLKEWRRKKAEEQHTAPYMVLEDKVLLLLATFIPRTKEMFLSLPHCGEKRWEQYGPELLALLEGQTASFHIPQAVAESAKPSRSQKQERQVLLLTRIQEGVPELDTLAKELDVSPNTVIGYLEQLIEDGYDIGAYVYSLTESVPYEAIMAAVEKIGAEKLKPIYLELNGDVPPYEAAISYQQIRLALVRRKLEHSSPA